MPTVAKDATAYTNPDAVKIMWNYDVNPTRAAHEVIRLTHIVRQELPRIKCPLLVVQSTLDTTIAADCADIVANEAASSQVVVERIHNSGHVIPVDAEWAYIAARTHQFFRDSV